METEKLSSSTKPFELCRPLHGTLYSVAIFLLASCSFVPNPSLAQTESTDKPPFSTQDWCANATTICWDEAPFENTLSGIRLSVNLNLGNIWQRGSNRFDTGSLGTLVTFGAEINLFRGWIGYQVFLAVPGTLKMDQYSPLGLYAALPDTTEVGGRTLADSIKSYHDTRRSMEDSINVIKAQRERRKITKQDEKRKIEEISKNIRLLEITKERQIREQYNQFKYDLYSVYETNSEAKITQVRELRTDWGWGTGLTFFNSQLALGLGRVYYDERSLPTKVQNLATSRYKSQSLLKQVRSAVWPFDHESFVAPFDMKDTFYFLTFQPGAALSNSFQQQAEEASEEPVEDGQQP